MPRNPSNPAKNDPAKDSRGKWKKGHSSPGPGRPTLYDPDRHNELALNLSLLGLTEAEMLGPMQLDHTTFLEWKAKHPAFAAAIHEGREPADGRVARALYKRAVGEVVEVEKEIVDPETGKLKKVKEITTIAGERGAQGLWLGNRRRKQWGTRLDVNHSGGLQLENAGLLRKLTPEERETIRAIIAGAAERTDEAEGGPE